DRAARRERLPDLRMRPLQRLREDLQLFQRGRALDDGVRAAVRIRRAELQHLVQPPPGLLGREVGDRLLVVPAGEDRRDREELALMEERRLGPALEDDLVCLVVEGAIALLILNGRERPAEDLRLARLVAPADAEFE